MRAKWGTAVRIAYELKEKDGPTIESSRERGPVTFVIGSGAILPALERRLVGMCPGDESMGEIAATEAFGDQSLLPELEVPLAEFPSGEPPIPGKLFVARMAAHERPVRFKVIAVGARSALCRLQHPLGDRDLEFKVTVLAVDLPPPPPARALGIDSAAIQLVVEDSRAHDLN